MLFVETIPKYSGARINREKFLEFLEQNPGSIIQLIGEQAPERVMEVIRGSSICEQIWFTRTPRPRRKPGYIIDITSLSFDQAMRYLQKSASGR